MIVPVTYFLQHVLPCEGSRSLFFTAHAFTQVYRSLFFYSTCSHAKVPGAYFLQDMRSPRVWRNVFFTGHALA